MERTKNWREQDTVSVGWVGRKSDMGTIPCEVLKRDRTNDEPHGVREVMCMGRPFPVTYCHSEERYVWVK